MQYLSPNQQNDVQLRVRSQTYSGSIPPNAYERLSGLTPSVSHTSSINSNSSQTHTHTHTNTQGQGQGQGQTRAHASIPVFEDEIISESRDGTFKLPSAVEAHVITAQRSSTSPDTSSSAHTQSNTLNIINRLSASTDMSIIQSLMHKSKSIAREYYRDDFGPLPEPIASRQFDSPTLRDLRKILENRESNAGKGTDIEEFNDSILSNVNLEELSLAMLDELPELSYDYLGNTVVQKLFTLVDSKLIRLMMVKEVTPYLTQLGCHKNGTYAVQKIIATAHGEFQQMYLIGASLKPYATKLFNDQFGNYVIQGCIKFGAPYNNFVFEALFDNFLQISLNRFGARCVRTILESSHDSGSLTDEQKLLVAALIVHHSNELIVNANGGLLVTWYLDTFHDYDNKVRLLVETLIPGIEYFCVHKLANLTILKLLNGRSNDWVRMSLVDAIFQNTKNLEFILQENNDANNSAGPLFIYKVLSNPALTELTSLYLPAIKRILMEVNIINYHNYKKLMDEVGLSNKFRYLNPKRNSKRQHAKLGKYGFYDNKYPIPYSLPTNQYVPQQTPFQPVVNTQPMYMMPYYTAQAPRQVTGQVPGQVQEQLQPQSHILGQGQALMQGQTFPNAQAHAHAHGHSHAHAHAPQFISTQQMLPRDLAVMQQLEQLSLSSAALGYTSNPGTPTMQRNLYI